METKIPLVLVIDDDEAIRKMLCLSLERYGYKAIAAAEASEGLALLEGEAYDAVMLDVQMPGMNGHAFLRATDRLDSRPPVIMMSGQAGIEDAIEGFHGGIADFITKPFTPREVAATLSKVLEQRRTATVRERPRPAAHPEAEAARLEKASDRGFIDAVRQELAAGRIGLPLPPALVDEALAIRDRTDVDTAEVVRLLEKLPQGAARILHLMKTPTYGMSGTKTVSLANAVQRLGIPMTISTALTAAVKDSFTISDPDLSATAGKMWENSVVTAGLTRIMAIRTGFVRPEAGYLIGLFHNIGELLYMRIYAEKQGAGNALPLEILAHEIIEHHTDLGHLMAKSWKLDELTCEICLHHHDPAYYEGAAAHGHGTRIAALAVLANLLAIQINGSYLPTHPVFPDAEQCRSLVGIQVRDLKVLVEDGKQTLHDLRASLAS